MWQTDGELEREKKAHRMPNDSTACIVLWGQTLSGIAQVPQERIWELAQVLLCNVHGNAGLPRYVQTELLIAVMAAGIDCARIEVITRTVAAEAGYNNLKPE